jgi:hypothetical protein
VTKLNSENFYKKAFFIASFVLLLMVVAAGYYFIKYNDLYWDTMYRYVAVPDIELESSMDFGENGATGKITGFVLFDDLSQQPKDARQYLRLQAFSSNGEQKYIAENIVKMATLEPRTIAQLDLKVIEDTSRSVILRDESGTQFDIDKLSMLVTVTGAGGTEKSYLITDEFDFRDFVASGVCPTSIKNLRTACN